MDDFYRHDPSISCADSGNFDNLLRFEGDFEVRRNETEICASEMSDLIKAQIASHPKYPSLVSAYIECRKVSKRRPKDPKRDVRFSLFLYVNHCVVSCLFCCFCFWQVGAPPEMATLLEEIGRENLPSPVCTEIGTDLELDEFMVNERGSCFSLFHVGFVNLRGFVADFLCGSV